MAMHIYHVYIYNLYMKLGAHFMKLFNY